MLEKVYAFVKQLDPHHPMTMAFCCCDPLTYKDAFDIGMSAQQSNPCRFLRCERLHKQPVLLTLKRLRQWIRTQSPPSVTIRR